MKNELLKEYNIRIIQSNRSQLVVIIYEIILEYIKDGRERIAEGNTKEFSVALKKAQQFIKELISSLDFNYPISNELLQLYLYYNRVLAKAMIKKSADELSSIEEMILNLKIGFEEVAKQDFSAPLMANTQRVYAGLTYGRKTYHEIYQDSGNNRGFMA